MRQSKNLPEASIRKFIGFHNPEYKKNVQFIEGHFCLCATLWGCMKKNVEVQEETVFLFFL